MEEHNSHEYARSLQALAEFLLSKPAFECPAQIHDLYLHSKGQIVEAVRVFGGGKKKSDDCFFYFYPDAPALTQIKFHICVAKREICHKVQEEVWECDPLFAEAP